MSTTTLSEKRDVATSHLCDSAGRVSSISLEINGQTWPVASAISWQPQGGLAGLTYGNGLVWTRTQHSNGLLTANTVPGVLAQGLAHDDADRLERSLSYGSLAGAGIGTHLGK